ncbi:MAG: phosphoribosylaminoimidazolesuccinocarboxamide synthase [Syntrophomonadaceae bacterium]|nr:phosphoribosylaminoimidazolesuccinocarboxamide synthase [Syntrophomonadaceae bacterium]
MELIYQGKTKDIYQGADGNIIMKFKDDATGEDGVFNPGANKVGLTIEGSGRAAIRLTKYFFDKLQTEGILTHYVNADIDHNIMVVKPATMFGEGLEVICRYRAVGSFIRRYGKYATEGQELDAFVEITLKDDDRDDPPITKDALIVLGLLNEKEYYEIKKLTKSIASIIKDELATKGIDLYDIKFEFGKIDEKGKIALIDEISGGNMRAFYKGKQVSPLELEKLILG